MSVSEGFREPNVCVTDADAEWVEEAAKMISSPEVLFQRPLRLKAAARLRIIAKDARRANESALGHVPLERRAAAQGAGDEFSEIVRAFEESAVMAARILKDEKYSLVGLIAKMREDIQRHADFPLGFDGDLQLAYSLALHVLLSREKAGEMETIQREYDYEQEDDGDE